MDKSFTNLKSNNHIIDGSFIHNQQLNLKECLNF
jgi:hypothetical protein